MEKTELKAILESLLFMSTEPLSAADLKKLLLPVGEEKVLENPTDDAASQLSAMQEKLESEISKSDIVEALEEIKNDYAQNSAHGFELAEVAHGYQFRTKTGMAPYLKNLAQITKFRLSTPSMETLAIVAYQQPIPRNKIEDIRGVDSGGVLKTLLDRDFVRIVGRSEEPGRPILYGTTKTFLEVFNLESLADLPTLKDLEEGAVKSTSPAEGAPAEGAPAEGAPVEGTDEKIADREAFSEAEEASGELIGELENSMRGLRDLERKIFEKDEKEPEA